MVCVGNCTFFQICQNCFEAGITGKVIGYRLCDSWSFKRINGPENIRGVIMVYDKIVELVVEYTDAKPEDISAESTFEDLGIDSLTTVELVMALEDEFGVDLEMDEKISTVGELANFVESKTA